MAVLAVVAAACSDEPTSPTVRTVTLAAASAVSAAQTAIAGDAVPVAPTVIVRDGTGTPVAGVSVAFAVTLGGGSVEFPNATTDANGVATSGRWVLGTEGPNEVQARIGTLTPVRFSATATPLSQFNIAVRYVTTPTVRQRQAVDAAVTRWRTVIVDDLTDIPINSPAGSCSASQPMLNELVDDLLLVIEFVDIDGVGKTLGSAGPCYIRMNNSLPVVGYMKLDAADLARMEQTGTLDDVVLHEIGHILGIGTLWSTKELIANAGTDDPTFTGAHALSEYLLIGGQGAGVPVENTGGTGTRDGHWRESVFANELMTGWVGAAPNPLSGMTVASLQDLGYGASMKGASGYILGGKSQGVTMSFDLRDKEKLHGPRYRVDHRGRKEKIDPPGQRN